MSKSRKKIGLPPGSVVYTGNKKVEAVKVHYLQYDSQNLEDKVHTTDTEIIFNKASDDKVDWYDVRGIHDTELIETLGKAFEIHPLILEDVADIHQRPKFDEYVKGSFIIIRALTFNKETLTVVTEQLAIYFRKGFVITFQETKSDLFESVRNRIHNNKGRIRVKGADYLAYSLMDLIVDNYFLVLDQVGEAIESLEDKLMTNQNVSSKGKIHSLKKELLVVRKSISPLREAISQFSKTDSPFVEEQNLVFIRDLYDHTIQIMDMVESYRDMLNGLQDLYMTEISFKMNQVMQLLTLVSTIFIPLTFLAGIYGMNFENMPELHWENGYYILLGVMAILLASLLMLFKYKKWI